MKRRRPDLKGAKLTYVVVDEANEDIFVSVAWGAALNRAQRLAEDAEDPVSYVVEADRVIGSRIPAYRVERDEDGVVFTRALSDR